MDSGMKNYRLGIAGLLLITFFSAIQYVFLSSIPDEVSTFGFIFVTNSIGLLILLLLNIRKLKLMTRAQFLKGLVLAVELIGFNFFLIIGSRGMDSVVISSVVAMYFIFITPILVILHRSVSFRGAVATAIAFIALSLIFGADFSQIFSSIKILYIFLADIFMALYIVTVDIIGADEDSTLLTISQMLSVALISLVIWAFELFAGKTSFSSMPFTSPGFIASLLFFGVFIRALYSVIQISAQKHVPPVATSLITSSEIIITLVLNPFLSKLFGTVYSGITVYQVIGCVFFVIAVLLTDDSIMARIGYHDMDITPGRKASGSERPESIARKFTNLILSITVLAVVVSCVGSLYGITQVSSTAVKDTELLGSEAATSSEKALKNLLEQQMSGTAQSMTVLAESRLTAYEESLEHIVSSAQSMLTSPEMHVGRDVPIPDSANAGIYALQRTLADDTITYDDVLDEALLFGNLENLMASVISLHPEVATIYLGTESGLLVSFDPFSETPETGELYYEYRNSEWYTLAREEGAVCFTDSYLDGFGRGLCVTCTCPYYTPDGTFAGAVGADILIDDFSAKIISDGIAPPTISFLIATDGSLIASAGLSGTSPEGVSEAEVLSSLLDASHQFLRGMGGLTTVKVSSSVSGYYLASSVIDCTGWRVCVASPIDKVIEPARDIWNSIETSTASVSASVYKAVKSILQNCLILFAVFLLIITFISGRSIERMIDPIVSLTDDVAHISSGDFSFRAKVASKDEVGRLAGAFNDMASSLQQYISDVKEATAKEQRIASELSVAAEIQVSMLPSVFPAFPNRHEFDIYASMDPAKEVGGDFYDFFLLDDSHLCLVMADVSSKSVPAAMFMSVSKSLIKSRALMGGKPSEILSAVNNQLCENNTAEMFVTVWLGILDLKTGLLTAANAGHEYPALARAGCPFELVKDRHGLVLAGMEGSRYRDYELQLNPGDKLFLYTDGVTEATSADNELFGNDRLVSSLNSHPFTTCEALISDVTQGINAFVGDAPQFDDITMLSLVLNSFQD